MKAAGCIGTLRASCGSVSGYILRMFGLDDWIARLGGSGVMAFAVALLLGLRHATDPDHLTAISTLFLGSRRDGPRRATLLRLAWRPGHGRPPFRFGLA